MFNKLLDPEGAKLPRLCQLGPEIGAAVSRLQDVPLPDLAADIMSRVYTPDYTPGQGLAGLGTVADLYLPAYGAPRLGDITPPEELALQDLLAEAMQLLEHARLVRIYPEREGHCWATTRLGRSALIAGNVRAILEHLPA